MPRPGCYVCLKAPNECICDLVPKVANRTFVHILQHPHEREHSIGTARIAKLGLERVRFEVAHDGLATSDEFRGRVPADARLLFPGDGAPELSELVDEPPTDLVVLDGSWGDARALARSNPWLLELPRARLAPAAPTRYRIRKAPRPHLVSTIEAVVQALEILEPDTEDLGGLLRAFDGMIDRQIEFLDESMRRPRQRRRPRKARRPVLPDVAPERFVLVYGEFLARGSGHEVVQWVVARPFGRGGSLEVVELLNRDALTELDARELRSLKLDPRTVAGGCSLSELRAAWAELVADDDVVIAWNQSTFTRVRPSLPLPGREVLLKAAFCNRFRRGAGHLEDAASRLGRELPSLAIAGRARARVAAAWAVLHELYEVDFLPNLRPSRDALLPVGRTETERSGWSTSTSNH